MDEKLRDALNDCLDRLANGETTDDCLAAYPDLADQLAPMLYTGAAVRRAGAPRAEVEGVTARLREQLDAEIAARDFDNPPLPPWRAFSVVIGVAATLVLVMGLALFLSVETDLLGPSDTLTPTPTMTASNTPQPSTATATITSTVTVSATPTATASPTATVTRTPTATPTIRVSLTPTAIPPTLASPQSAACVVSPPDDWVIYQIASGDTLSGIAVAAGITLEELSSINCIDDPRLIVVGTDIYVPRPIIPPSDATALPDAPPPPGAFTVPDSPPSSGGSAPSTGNDGDDDGGGDNRDDDGGGDDDERDDDDDDD